MKSAVAVKNLSHSFGSQPVLRNLSFRVQQGDVFIIIGPNGSGKTTLIKLIVGVLKIQSGQVDILQHPLRNYSQKSLARAIAYVPQGLPLGFPFKVEETVLMGRAPHQNILGLASENDADVADQAMKFTEVAHLAHRKMDQLSGGEQQRVFIARALCQEPDVIFLDEPTASLDLAHQVRIMDLMERLKVKKGVTVVMVSHDVNLAGMYADRLLLLNGGKVESIGRPDSVLTYPQLEKTYGCEVLVDPSPIGGLPRVTLIPNRFLNSDKKQFFFS